MILASGTSVNVFEWMVFVFEVEFLVLQFQKWKKNGRKNGELKPQVLRRFSLSLAL
jgi:hypothetical protein